jgi:hypothetical protein
METLQKWFLGLFLALPVILTVSDIVHRRLVGLKINVWEVLFGFGGLISTPVSGSSKGFKGGGGGFGGGGASGGW